MYGYAVIVVHPGGTLEAWDSMLAFARERHLNPSTVTKAIAERGEFCFNGSVVQRVKLNEVNEETEINVPKDWERSACFDGVGEPVNLFSESFAI